MECAEVGIESNQIDCANQFLQEQGVAEAQDRVERIGRGVVTPVGEAPLGRGDARQRLPVAGRPCTFEAADLVNRPPPPHRLLLSGDAAYQPGVDAKFPQMLGLRPQLLTDQVRDERSCTRRVAQEGILCRPVGSAGARLSGSSGQWSLRYLVHSVAQPNFPT